MATDSVRAICSCALLSVTSESLKGDSMQNKRQCLEDTLRRHGRLAVALSGGVDSSLLLAVARDLLGSDQVLALHAEGPFMAAVETTHAESWAAALKVRLLKVPVDMLAHAAIRNNGPERCYHCKKLLMGALQEAARQQGFSVLADGSNVDDRGDYRPGRRAADELQVQHPLEDAGMGKEDIRKLARLLGLPNWDLPAAACLASRVPTGTAIDASMLRQIEQGEAILRQHGLQGIRLRHFGSMAKIEAPPEAFTTILARRQELLAALHELGFSDVVLDLAGYRMGAMNAPLPAPCHEG